MSRAPAHPSSSRQRQGGAILFALLAFSLFGMVAYLYLANGRAPRTAQSAEAALQKTLARASEALIARAMADDNRPGSLPCPDLLTDTPSLANYPGDGKTDLLTRNQCPSQIGWLPWVTLDMPQTRDDHQGTLWYVIAPGLSDDESAMPINSDKTTGLALHGTGEIAALLIAARAPLPGQHRPSALPENHLEGQLKVGPTLDYIGHTRPDNDKILAISRGELMAAVEQGIAQRVRHCLSAHAGQTGRYPWPAPLSSTARQGQRDALFGRVPLTQPSDGISRDIAQASADLTRRSANLTAATDAPGKLTALSQLAEFSTRAKNLFTNVDDVADEVKILGDKVTLALNKVQASIASAAENDRIAVSEGNAILTQQTAAIIAVNTLSDALFRYGLDALSWQAGQPGLPMGVGAENAHAALTDQLKQLQEAGETFAAQHNAQPRPLQALLVAPAQAIATRADETARLSQVIAKHATAIIQLATANFALAAQMSDANSKASTAISTWQDKPSASNRNKMDTALSELAQTTTRLSTGLQDQTATTTSSAAAAWPISWASAHCAFLKKGPGWWNDNAWAELFFYQITTPDSLIQGDLRVGGKDKLPLLVLSAGPALTGQTRPANRIENYLERRNADPSRNGEARSPSPFFDLPSNREPINDRIAY
ncbi:hypothetical protein [Azonexus sp.]|uniref:hypothetical protein n=1 Tax=Azonexus sp. TaxID=1872668 RepID=UPI0027BA5CB1|nr:hypothetical protein [Azonexus sp.]